MEKREIKLVPETYGKSFQESYRHICSGYFSAEARFTDDSDDILAVVWEFMNFDAFLQTAHSGVNWREFIVFHGDEYLGTQNDFEIVNFEEVVEKFNPDEIKEHEFNRIMTEELKNLFPHSDLKAEYSVEGSPAEDYLTITGAIAFEDIQRLRFLSERDKQNLINLTPFIGRSIEALEGYSDEDWKVLQSYAIRCDDIRRIDITGSEITFDNINFADAAYWTVSGVCDDEEVARDILNNFELTVIDLVRELYSYYNQLGYEAIYPAEVNNE